MAKIGCYAVARGRMPGIYMDWKDCSAQVINYNGAKYKKFLDPAEAELWINANAGPSAVRKSTTRTEATVTPIQEPRTGSVAEPISQPSEAAVTSAQAPNGSSAPSASRVQTALSMLERHAVLPPHPEIGTTASPLVSESSRSAASNPMVVYTDGSCRGNGRTGSTAGIGVWWGIDDSRNVSERCPGDQTNNRAELIAIIRVLERAPTDRPLEIRSDSAYSINSMTIWLQGWKMRGWKKPDGKPVQNLALIQYADLLLEERRRVLKQPVEFKKVLAHSGIEGNEAADKLANDGAALAAIPEQDWNSLIRGVRARIDAACLTQTASVPRAATSLAKQIGSPVPQPSASVSRPAKIQPLSPVRSPATTSASLSSNPTPASRSTETMVSTLVPRTTAELTSSDVVHGRLDLRIMEGELEIYADCLLDDDAFMLEAELEGVCAA
ncbi:RnaseH-domain-containing protein [Lentinus tigrinus ALCF2SS1-7]|uniref:Ribonuclease H n=1 Tax=Lentinus tigrinus ALCF2SS1-6 TaxID=1328759 RepID=A0A5C2SPW2_9APHY|nr:RnaseH-domain-containing protein [Lentinus tigrinus ALCF2SS1-6]RPD79217.1 RnaseH-domain-containing protein [Lentinus tigrinus ALCF2SS1-7]